LLTAAKMSGTAVLEVGGLALVVGFVSAFVFGLLSVSFLMKFLKRFSLGVFAGYLILIGALVLLYN